MNDRYVDERVREALTLARGSRGEAQKLLVAWAMRDDRLLQEIARPFLKAICGAAVEGAWRRGVRPGTTPPVRQGQLSQDAVRAIVSQIGRADQGAAGGADGELSLGDIFGRASDPAQGTGAGQPQTGDGAAGMETRGRPGQSTAIRTLAAAFLEQKARR